MNCRTNWMKLVHNICKTIKWLSFICERITIHLSESRMLWKLPLDQGLKVDSFTNYVSIFCVCAIDVRRLSKAKPIWLDDELCMRRADIKRTNNLCSSIEQNIENMVQESTTPTYNWIFKTNLSMLSAHIAEIDCMNHNGIDRWCCCCVTDSNIIGDVALWLFGKNENAWQKHLLLVYLRFHSRSFSIRMLDVMGAWKNIPALLMLFACAMLFQCVAVAVSLCWFAWVCGGRFVCVRSA